MTERTLTDADISAILDAMKCRTSTCPFTAEEVQFVRGWLDTMKTAKSEVVKLAVKGLFWIVGVVAAVSVAVKMGLFGSK